MNFSCRIHFFHLNIIVREVVNQITQGTDVHCTFIKCLIGLRKALSFYAFVDFLTSSHITPTVPFPLLSELNFCRSMLTHQVSRHQQTSNQRRIGIHATDS